VKRVVSRFTLHVSRATRRLGLYPANGVTVAFIVDHGAPIEFLQFDRPESEVWPHDGKFKTM